MLRRSILKFKLKKGIQNKHILGPWIRSKLHLLVILLFDPVPYVEKKFKNHAISPRITHFLLLTGFWRLFHRVHGRLAFPPSFSQLFGVYLFLTLVRDQSTAARVAFSRGSPTSPSSSWTKLWQLAKTWINHSKKLFQFKLWIYEFHNILLKSQEICCIKRQYIKNTDNK